MKKGYFTSSDMMHFDTIEECSLHELALLYKTDYFDMRETFWEDSVFLYRNNFTVEQFIEMFQVCTVVYISDWWNWKNLYNVVKEEELLPIEDIISKSGGGWFEWLKDEQNPNGHWVRVKD